MTNGCADYKNDWHEVTDRQVKAGAVLTEIQIHTSSMVKKFYHFQV